MSRHTLQEWSKFLAGVIAADFFSTLWFSQVGMFPVDFYGMSVTADMILPALVFDIAVFLILVHYGWNIGKMPRVRERSYFMAAGVIFTIVTAAHLWRLFGNADLVLDGWQVPLWLSWFGVMIAGFLAYTSFHFAMRMPNKK